MKARFSYITKPILILSAISLFTDMASEMLYPIMPLYLESIGFSILLIGILEGFAEAIAGLSKGYFGQLSDSKNKRLPFVQIGYFLSAISKPMLALFVFPIWIFLSRTIDRIGKGIRSAPRDAMLAKESSIENKAKVFGFHRSMDTMGAVIGPLLALLFLFFYPENYVLLFILAFIPGVFSIFLTFLLKEKLATQNQEKRKIHFFSFLQYYKQADKKYKHLISLLLIFALVNSSDVLLLLKMKESGVDDKIIITLYILFNLVFAIFAWPAGILADKFGLKKIFVFGLFLFAIVYAGFTVAESVPIYLLLYVIYGIYAACTEGIAKAWISNITKSEEHASAIGTYSAFNSICALIASSFAGFIWMQWNAAIAFGFSAIVAFLVATILLISRNKEKA